MQLILEEMRGGSVYDTRYLGGMYSWNTPDMTVPAGATRTWNVGSAWMTRDMGEFRMSWKLGKAVSAPVGFDVVAPEEAPPSEPPWAEPGGCVPAEGHHGLAHVLALAFAGAVALAKEKARCGSRWVEKETVVVE
jgi:hypothetical protein